MYSGEPKDCPVRVSRCPSDSRRATPKSMILTAASARAAEAPLVPRIEEHDVRRLEVAVDDAVLVRVVDRPGHLHHDLERVAPVHRPFGRALGERPSLQVFEDDEELSARRVLADVVADDDSRMREPGRYPRLGEEPLLELAAGHLTRRRRPGRWS